MSRVLVFQQITDSRFMDRKECLDVLNKRINKLKELLDIEGLEVSIGKPYLLEWGNKEDNSKLSQDRKNQYKYDTDDYHIQYRADFRIRKHTRKTTWNDIHKIINSVKAVPYSFQ